MSMGSSSASQLIRDACAYAYGREVFLVAAAGNNSGAVIYPAAYPEVVAVGAVDSRDRLASFSSRGPEIELAAPGVSIHSTTLGGGYGTKSGTSMACPHSPAPRRC